MHWRRECLPTPVFLPEEYHGKRSLAGHSSRGCKELDMALKFIRTLFFFFFLVIRTLKTTFLIMPFTVLNWAVAYIFWSGPFHRVPVHPVLSATAAYTLVSKIPITLST